MIFSNKGFIVAFVVFFSFIQSVGMQKSASFPQESQKINEGNMFFINKAKRSVSEPNIKVTKRSTLERITPLRVCSTRITPQEVKEFNEARTKIVQSKIIEESK